MPEIYTVSSAIELYSALNMATGGDTIQMAGGDYGNLNLKYVDLDFESPVTITSVDADNHAIISEMTLDGARNVTFEAITFKSYYTAGATWYEPFIVRNSEGITFDNVLFEGTPVEGVSVEEDGTGIGKGLYVEKSSDIMVTDSEIAMWYRGMHFSEVQNLTVTGNDVHSIRSDGINLGGIQTALIEDNYIHDFKTVPSSGDHADMIQVMNLGSVTSSDIVFRGNTFDIGDGDTVQTLFMRNQIVDQSGAGIESFYQNITIEENVILNGHAHGITVGETNNLVVRKNSVLSIAPDDTEYSSAPYITVAGDSLNVVIEQNVSQSISGYNGQLDWQVLNNYLIQNTHPEQAGYYQNEFITSTLDDESVNAITVRSDSDIAENGAGATRMLSGQSNSAVEPLFNLYTVEHDAQTIFFDARETFSGSAGLLPDGTEFHWDFGQGNTATGITVQHSYSESGAYVASLTVVTPDGATFTEMTGVDIAGSDVLSMDPLTGDFLQHYYGESTDIRNSRAIVENTSGGEKVLAIGQSTGVSTIPNEALARFFGADNFELSMTLKADLAGTSYGEIARIHDSFYLKTDPGGNIDFLLALDTGFVRATTTGVSINDGKIHDISIVLDGEMDVLSIVVDGNQVASVSAEGNVRAMAYWGMTVGNGWGKQTFEGQVGNLELDIKAYDYPKISNTEITSASDLAAYVASPDAGLEFEIGAEEAPSDTEEAPSDTEEASSDTEAAPSDTATSDAGNVDQTTTTILSLDPLTGNFLQYGPNENTAVEDAKVYLGDTSSSGKAMEIGNDTGVSYVAKEALAAFFATDSFEVSMTLQGEEAEKSHGEIARIHDSFILTSDKHGNLKFVLYLESGAVKVKTTGVALNDGKDHDISIRFDNETDLLKIEVDGREAASVTAEGDMKDMAYWDLTFGNPWGKKHNFDGQISDFQIDVAAVAADAELANLDTLPVENWFGS